MQGNRLNGMRVAIVATDDFEQAELVEPKKALEQAGATTKIISTHSGQITGMNHDVKADTFNVDMTLDQANPDDFDAVMLPGGALNADALTSYYTIQDDIRNAGGNWVDKEMVRDGNWVTSRSPKDLPAFNPAMIQLFSESKVPQR
jgi:protease I